MSLELFGNDEELREYMVHRQRQDQMRRMERDARVMARQEAALSDVKPLQDVGTFIRIRGEGSWQAHSQAVREGALTFSPSHYPYFDEAIVDQYKNKALFDATHRNYPQMEPMRHNLEVMRNYLFNYYLPPDGKFDHDDPKDAQKVAYMQQIAEALGEMLHNGAQPISNPLKLSVDMKKVNTEGSGAAELYKALLKQQERNHRFDIPIVTALIHWIRHDPDTHWKLPPIEETPFADRFLFQSPVGGSQALGSGGDPSLPPSPPTTPCLAPENLDPSQLGTVEALHQPVKRDAIDEARKILERMRAKFGNLSPEEIRNLSPEQVLELNTSMKQISDVYRYHLEQASLLSPDILERPTTTDANEAFGVMGCHIKTSIVGIAQNVGSVALVERYKGELNQMPKEWHHPPATSLKALFNQIDRGIDDVADRIQTVQQSAPASNALGKGIGFDMASPSSTLAPQAAGAAALGSAAMAASSRTPVQAAQQALQAQSTQARAQGLNVGTSGAPAAIQQAAAVQQQSNNMKALVGDVNQYRTPLNAPTTGQMVQPGSAQKVIQDELARREQLTRQQNRAEQRERRQQQAQTQQQQPQSRPRSALPPSSGAFPTTSPSMPNLFSSKPSTTPKSSTPKTVASAPPRPPSPPSPYDDLKPSNVPGAPTRNGRGDGRSV